jgi:hypothetical protein
MLPLGVLADPCVGIDQYDTSFAPEPVNPLTDIAKVLLSPFLAFALVVLGKWLAIDGYSLIERTDTLHASKVVENSQRHSVFPDSVRTVLSQNGTPLTVRTHH